MLGRCAGALPVPGHRGRCPGLELLRRRGNLPSPAPGRRGAEPCASGTDRQPTDRLAAALVSGAGVGVVATQSAIVIAIASAVAAAAFVAPLVIPAWRRRRAKCLPTIHRPDPSAINGRRQAMIDYAIYCKIHEAHHKQGLTGAQIAREMDMDVRTVARW